MKSSSVRCLILALVLMCFCAEPTLARAGGGGGRSSSRSSSSSKSKSRSKTSSSSKSTKKKQLVIVSTKLTYPMTIAVLSHMYDVKVDSLKKYNSDLRTMAETDTIYSGSSIRHPKKTPRKVHHVIEGDTWETVATKYEVKVDKLKKANEKFVTGALVVGQTIFIPADMVKNGIILVILLVVGGVILFFGARLYFKMKG